MMTERGIKANPEKIEALRNLLEPRWSKDVQRLNGCIAALGRFISKSVEMVHAILYSIEGNGKRL